MQNFKVWVHLLIAMCFIGCVPSAFSASQCTTSPCRFVAKMSQRVIGQIKAGKSIRGIVNRTVMPKVNISYMAMRVTARGVWRKAGSAQRRRFLGLFRKKMASKYTRHLTDNKRKIRQSSNTVKIQRSVSRGSTATVYTLFRNFKINYKLKKRAGSWSIIDIRVAGAISLRQFFRSQYRSFKRLRQLNDCLEFKRCR